MSQHEQVAPKSRWFQFEGLLTDNRIISVYLGMWGEDLQPGDEDQVVIQHICEAYADRTSILRQRFGADTDPCDEPVEWVGYNVTEVFPEEWKQKDSLSWEEGEVFDDGEREHPFGLLDFSDEDLPF